MSTLTILVLIALAASVLLAISIVAVASVAEPNDRSMSPSELRPSVVARRPTPQTATAGTVLRTPPTDLEPEREPVSQTEYDVTRRKFFNRATYVVFGLFLAQFAVASLAFLWPKLKGGFGLVPMPWVEVQYPRRVCRGFSAAQHG